MRPSAKVSKKWGVIVCEECSKSHEEFSEVYALDAVTNVNGLVARVQVREKRCVDLASYLTSA